MKVPNARIAGHGRSLTGIPLAASAGAKSGSRLQLPSVALRLVLPRGCSTRSPRSCCSPQALPAMPRPAGCRTATAHRRLANAEAGHGRHDAPAQSTGGRARRRSCGCEGVSPADRGARVGARPGKDGVRAGGAGHAPQTEPAESEAVSGDRTRPPPAHSPPPPGRPASPRRLLAPDLARGLDDEPQLRACSSSVSALPSNGRGEAALRRQAELVERRRTSPPRRCGA